MSIESINEPGHSRLVSHTPPSINEPPEVPPLPAPVISTITPDTAAIGDADFTLVVAGDNFFAGTVIFFAGHDEPTSFDEADRTVSTLVKPSLWQAPATVQCQVHNAEMMSNAVDFTFTDAGATAAAHHDADPDDLEDEIDEAIEDGDAYTPTHETHHRGTPTKTLSHKRSKAKR
ncbi:MAG TPA: hypothetical protein VHT00_14240 [Stellaceae bacterium]|jgi:hypothetical protein|nr:hypothetical protein [Stellaceae bacterium]